MLASRTPRLGLFCYPCAESYHWKYGRSVSCSMLHCGLFSVRSVDVSRPCQASWKLPPRRDRFNFLQSWLLWSKGLGSIGDLSSRICSVGKCSMKGMIRAQEMWKRWAEVQNPGYPAVVTYRSCFEYCRRYSLVTDAATLQPLRSSESTETGFATCS